MDSQGKSKSKSEVETLLLRELELVNEKINHFDDLRHRTKQMAITLWVASLGVALTLPARPLLLLATFVPLPFWLSDARYHAYSEGFDTRVWAIVRYLRGDDAKKPGEWASKGGVFPIPDLYGSHTYDSSYHKGRTALRRNATTPYMLLFYIPLVAIPLLLAAVYPSLAG